MISDLHKERFNVHLGELATNKTPCGIFFGFVVVPSQVVNHVQALRNSGINLSCVIVLADLQAAAVRKSINLPVITLKDFSRFGKKNFPVKPQEIFIPNVVKDLAFVPYFTRYGMKSLTMLYAVNQNEYFHFMMMHLPELYSVYNMLGSDESKKVFLAVIKGRLTGKISNYRFAPEPQYFLEGFTPSEDDIAIDGGAYDCGTSISFAKYGAKVFAFEMDAENYKKCLARLNNSKYDITLENLGLSDKEGIENYFSNSVGSKKNPNGTSTGNFIDLDTYVAKKICPASITLNSTLRVRNWICFTVRRRQFPVLSQKWRLVPITSSKICGRCRLT